MRKLIINADDFGYSPVFNESILELLRNGKISSTTVMVNWITAEQNEQVQELIDLWKTGKISVGLHIEFTPEDKDYVQKIEQQLKKFKEIFKQSPGHLDMHKSGSFRESHEIVADYSKQFGIPCRNWGQRTKGITTRDKVFFATEAMGKIRGFEDIENWLKTLEGGQTYEICFHPGKFDPNCKSSLNAQREKDIENILKLNDILSANKVMLATFNDLCEDEEIKREQNKDLANRNLSVR